MNTPIKSAYCQIHSHGCSKQTLEDLARKLRPQLKRKKALNRLHIDILTNESPPVVFCYERNAHINLLIEDNVVTVPKVEPLLVDELPSLGAWACDLVKNTKTFRRPFDYCLPERESMLRLLNTPGGNFFNFNEIVGFGLDAVSVRFENHKDTRSVRFMLPTEAEVFETIFAEAGIQMNKDDKNVRYSQALRILGDINKASAAVTGTSGKIISALLKGPLDFSKIREKAKLGDKTDSRNLPEFAKMILGRLDENARRIAEKRMDVAANEILDKDLSDIDVLGKLIVTGVIKRKMYLLSAL